MIIVSGKLIAQPGRRQELLDMSAPAIRQARASAGCLDFTVAADLLEDDRVNVYEAWESEAALEAFRGAGPGGDMRALIRSANVARHVVSSSGPA